MRAIWSGAISFGLIYIPVNVYNATQTHELTFHMLRQGDLCPIRYARVCKDTREEVAYSDIVRGFEYQKGKYVVMTDEDFRAANVKKTQTIDIVAFVDADAVEPKYLQKPYYLGPDPEKGGAGQVYALLRDALQKSGKVGIARFVMHNREHLAMIQPEGEVLNLIQMRFASEIHPPEGVQLPDGEPFSTQELDMAVRLVEELSQPWNPDQYQDSYVQDLTRLIREKIQGKEPQPAPEEVVPEDVSDLFAKLNASVQQAKEGRREKSKSS